MPKSISSTGLEVRDPGAGIRDSASEIGNSGSVFGLTGPRAGFRRHAFERLVDVVIGLLVRKRFYRFWSLVHEASLHGMGVLNYRRAGTGESAFLRWLGQIAKEIPGPHYVVDVGANTGNYAAEVRDVLPEARILCFEPHPRTVEKLYARASALRLDIIPMGVSNQAGELELHDRAADPGSEHATLYRDVIVDLARRPVSSVGVSVTTLDAALAERGINRVLLLKIDTEGHELAVLQGARQSLARGMFDVIQLEFNEMNVFSRTFFRDLLEPLAGYRLFRMLPDGLVGLDYSPRKTEIFGFQNIVAIRHELDI